MEMTTASPIHAPSLQGLAPLGTLNPFGSPPVLKKKHGSMQWSRVHHRTAVRYVLSSHDTAMVLSLHHCT
jgi:hypothetical protein